MGPSWDGGCRNRRVPVGRGDAGGDGWVPAGMGNAGGGGSCVSPLLGMMEEAMGVPRVRVRSWGAPETSQPQALSNTLHSSAQGLFRVAPSASKLKKLKAALDCCVVDVQEYSADPHAIAGGAPRAGVAPPGTPQGHPEGD